MSFWRDLRVGARMLARKPAFTAVVVLALGLGLGVNAVVFSAVDLYLLRPLPVSHPERLTSVFSQELHDLNPRTQLSFPDYQVLRDEQTIFDGVIATHFDEYAFGSEPMAGGHNPGAELLPAEVVSGNYFEILGVRAALGRTFSRAEGEDPAADPVVVLSDALWHRRFGASPSVLGRKVSLNGNSLTVIGVAPARFRGVLLPANGGVQYWYPLAAFTKVEGWDPGWMHDRARREISVLGRLRAGLAMTEAQARVAVIGQRLAREFPATNHNIGLRLVSEIEGRYGTYYGRVKATCLMALLLGGLVLLICCANVANLLLARAAGRTKEIGIRLALGAGRARVVRQLMTESLLLAAMGGLLGLGVAAWLPQLLHALVPPMPNQFELDIALDGRVIAAVGLAALLAGVLFGSLPAWRASQGDLITALKTDLGAEGQRLRRGSLRQTLVVAQVAISVVVVLIGGLIARSVHKLEETDPGYRPDTLVSAQLNPGFFHEDGDPALAAYFKEVERRLAQLPGVRSVSNTALMPLVNIGDPKGPVVREGDAPPPPNEGMTTQYSVVGPKYFETIGTELLAGRDFTAAEHAGVPSTAIVNGEMARRLFGGVGQALGKRFRIGGPKAPFLSIVGVARDGRYARLSEDPITWVFLPGCPPEIDCEALSFRTMLVRAAAARDLPAIAQGLRREVMDLDARIPIEELHIGPGHLAPQLYEPRVAAEMGALLALLALGLATLGVYSVMTYAVSQRTKEIGIRMALGGQVQDVMALVMRQGLTLAAVGVGLGTAAALALGRLLTSMLYGVTGNDPPTVLGTVFILLLVALLATLVPARRATKVSPMIAIRYDQNR
jgi:predicted permease